jgi:capsular exopolysaccharide synthesis family protein
VLRVKKQVAVYMSDPAELPVSQDTAPIGLHSTSACPLIIDPTQKVAAEHFGVLRSRLLSACNKSDFHSVVVTSPQTKDGKSFTSLNLAISLAQLNQLRILLIDGDLRLNGLTQILGLKEQTGLADFLLHWAPFEECVRPTALSHLYVAPAGNVGEESPPTLLEGSRWPEFILKAKQDFDLVIVDSVPVSAPIADLELLLKACDAAILVVHIRKTTREAMDLAANQMHGKLLGVVVNNKESRPDFDYHSSS